MKKILSLSLITCSPLFAHHEGYQGSSLTSALLLVVGAVAVFKIVKSSK